MSYYQIDVQSANPNMTPDVKYAQAFGDLDTINYIAKKVVKQIEGVSGNLVLALNEVDGIGGQFVREVVSVTAGAKVVATVLKGELTSERRSAKSAPTETPAHPLDREVGADFAEREPGVSANDQY